jgi:uncharacterized protein with NRDE domain
MTPSKVKGVGVKFLGSSGICILALAWRAHPLWHLVLAGNRDELHERPAAALSRWPEAAHIIAGRDLQSGGTWLGVSEEGRLAVVTNVSGYGAAEPGRPSRGTLLKDFLAGEGQYADPADESLSAFNPFNLITVADREARFSSNRPTIGSHLLSPGVYGLSNGALDEPWPKTTRLKSLMQSWLDDDATGPDRLLDGLREEAADSSHVHSADAAVENKHSSIFIRNPLYGTRCSTVAAIDHTGAGRIWERRFDGTGEIAGDTVVDFSWKDALSAPSDEA